jgi:hypothetical protein
MTKRGRWVTAVQGDGAGFPDLVLAHSRWGQVIFAELKTEIGRLSLLQDKWISVLGKCQDKSELLLGVRVFVWRPSDIEEIEEVLRG